MKKYMYVSSFIVILISCDSNTYESLEEPIITGELVTYDADVKSIINENCIFCHSPGGQASFRPLTTYSEVVNAIQNTDFLDRIQRQNGESGQMPQAGRMPQEKINVILQWNDTGLTEN